MYVGTATSDHHSQWMVQVQSPTSTLLTSRKAPRIAIADPAPRPRRACMLHGSPRKGTMRPDTPVISLLLLALVVASAHAHSPHDVCNDMAAVCAHARDMSQTVWHGEAPH